jgi:hypothetical protein
MDGAEAGEYIASRVVVSGAMVAVTKERAVRVLRAIAAGEGSHDTGLRILDRVLQEMAPDVERSPHDRRHLAPVAIGGGGDNARLHGALGELRRTFEPAHCSNPGASRT